MDEDEWVTYQAEDDLEIWVEKYKPSQVLNTSSSKVCGIAISVPISSNTLNNNTSELEEGFRSLTSQKDDMRLLHVEEQATTVLVSTDKLLLKVNSHHVDDVWRGLIMNLHQGQFGQKVYRVEVTLAADMNKMKTDYVICVYNEKLTAAYDSLNDNIMKENNNGPAIDRRNVVRNKNDKKAKIKKPCKCFNEGSCKAATAHLSKSGLTRWLHICRFCFETCGDEKPHPENQCEYQKNAADKSLSGMARSDDELVDENENIPENKEGSELTLVASNVYPACSCGSGGNKGCSSNSCKCIKFSQECLPSCGCGQACANMGLTRGEGKRVRIGPSTVQGQGCFTEEDIGKGEYVGEYTGEIVLRADQLKKENPSKFLFEIGHNDFLLDAENFGSEMAKMNHKTEKKGANCVYKLKRANGEWRVGVWAIKNIKKDEELFANYSNKYRGHGLFTPTKKKNKKGRRQGAKVEVKESRRQFIENRKGAKDEEKESQVPLIENEVSQSPSPDAFISNATKISHEEIKSNPIIKRKTRRLVSMENSLGASSLNDPSTPTRVVGSRAVCNQPRVLMLDSLDKTNQNQSLNAELPIARTSKKLFEENVKSNSNAAAKIPNLNANKDTVHMPKVTIATKEKDICEGKLYKKLSKENVLMPTVTITHKENNICKGKLNKKLSEENVKSNSNVAAEIPSLNANTENVRMPRVTVMPKEKAICKEKPYNKLSEENVKSKSYVAAKILSLNANKENVPMPTVTITPKEKDICKRKLYDSANPLRSTSNIKITPLKSSPRIKAKVDYKNFFCNCKPYACNCIPYACTPANEK